MVIRDTIPDLHSEQLPYYTGKVIKVTTVDGTHLLTAEMLAPLTDFKLYLQQAMAVTPSGQITALEILSVAKTGELFTTVTLRFVNPNREGERAANWGFVERDTVQLVLLSGVQNRVPAGLTMTLVPNENFDGELDANEGQLLAQSIQAQIEFEEGLGVEQLPGIFRDFKTIDVAYVSEVQRFSKTTAQFPIEAVVFRIRALNRQYKMYFDLPVDALRFKGLEHNNDTKIFTNVGLIETMQEARLKLQQQQRILLGEAEKEKKIKRRQDAVEEAQDALYPEPEVELPREAFLMSLFREDGSIWIKRMRIDNILAIRSKKGVEYRVVSIPVEKIIAANLIADGQIDNQVEVKVGSILFERITETN